MNAVLGALGAPAADGEIRKVDANTAMITLKQDSIPSIDMPPMTMVFQVKDRTMLDQVQPGDKARFKAEKSAGACIVTQIEAAK